MVAQSTTTSNRRERATSDKIVSLFQSEPQKLAAAGQKVIDQLWNQRAEESLVGCVFHKPTNYHLVASIVQAGDFYQRSLGLVWFAFEELDRKGQTIDMLSVLDVLTKYASQGIDEMYLTNLIFAPPTVDHVVKYAELVYDAARLRRILMAADKIRDLALAPGATADVDMIVDQCNQTLYTATDQRLNIRDATLMGTAGEELEGMADRMEKNIPITGFLTGFPRLDEKIGGFQAKELTIIGGDAGQGKTTWMLSVILNALLRGEGIALFTLEMTRTEITRALAAMMTGISKNTLRSGVCNADEYARLATALGQISKFPMYVIDKEECPDLTPLQHKRRLRALMATYPNIKACFIDGLWLMEPSVPSRKEDRPGEVKQITKDLIKTGDELAIPIILMHQYTRDFAKSQGTKKQRPPLKFDFAEASWVERNTQVMIALHRPAIYAEDDTLDDITYAYVLKARNNSEVDRQATGYRYDPQKSLYAEIGNVRPVSSDSLQAVMEKKRQAEKPQAKEDDKDVIPF